MAPTRICGTTRCQATVELRSVELQILRGSLIDSDQADSVFSGISTFGRINYHPCLKNDFVKYDIAFIGMHGSQTSCSGSH